MNDWCFSDLAEPKGTPLNVLSLALNTQNRPRCSEYIYMLIWRCTATRTVGTAFFGRSLATGCQCSFHTRDASGWLQNRRKGSQDVEPYPLVDRLSPKVANGSSPGAAAAAGAANWLQSDAPDAGLPPAHRPKPLFNDRVA